MVKCLEIQIYVVSYALKTSPCLSFSLNGFEIDHVDNFNNLNLIAECHIDWNLNSIGIKIAGLIGLLRKLKHRQLHKYCDLFITHSYCHIRFFFLDVY